MEQTAEITWFPVSLRKHPDTDREVLITVQCSQAITTYVFGVRITDKRISRYVDMGYYDFLHETWELSNEHAMYGEVIAWAEKPTVYKGDTFGI